MAAVSFALLVVVSLRPVRTKSYGLFFWVHFTMVLSVWSFKQSYFGVCLLCSRITLVGSYYHTKNFK